MTIEDLRLMRQAGRVASGILKKLQFFLKPEISTKNIESFLEKEISKYPDMKLAFKGFMGYPASCCVSINEEIIHGIPSQKLISDGDLVSVDLGIKYKGLFIDTARTYIVGKTTNTVAKKLVKVSYKALLEGIRWARVGLRLGDIGFAIQSLVEKNGFSVIRKFVGHGIGRQLHQPPE
ncbi:MAG: type I methionyl aminopeptidase, partial [Candidatus Omnitrophica bacterium]|nr:type I methionyl aminopeptidase [Candidatus Omnitrophota bacterium]